jgi:hypothetical protein
VSPHLAFARPLPFALIHVSERSRNARIADDGALWTEFFAPVLGAFETLKEEHLPVATINDLQLESGIPPQTQVVILPHERELGDAQRAVLRKFEAAGGAVLALDADRGWHLKNDKPRLKQGLLERIAAAGSPPIRARGPAAMHAVFYRRPGSEKTVACLVNDFGWFRSEREPSAAESGPSAPPPCRNVVLEIPASQPAVRRALEAVTGEELVVRRDGPIQSIVVPEFAVVACVVIESSSQSGQEP